jgi:hypothetical protein
MPVKPTPALRAAAEAGDATDKCVLQARVSLFRSVQQITRSLATIDNLINKVGGLAEFQSALGPDAADFEVAYNHARGLVLALEGEAADLHRDRTEDLAGSVIRGAKVLAGGRPGLFSPPVPE